MALTIALFVLGLFLAVIVILGFFYGLGVGV